MEKMETRTSKTPVRPKVFQNHWLTDPNFQAWLCKGKDPETAYCQACAVTIKAGKSELQTHAKTKKHCNRLEALVAANDIDEAYELQQQVEVECGESRSIIESLDGSRNQGNEPSFKRKKLMNRKVFQDKWLSMPEFVGWLQKGDASDLAYCIKCQVILQAGKSELLVHAKTKKHIARMDLTTEEVFDLIPPRSPTEEVELPTWTVDLRTDAFVPMKMVKQRESDSDEEMNEKENEGPQKIVTSATDYALGTDHKTEVFEQKLASVLGMDTGILFPTEIMANFAAVLAHCPSRGSHVVYGRGSQMAKENDEALRKIAGLATEKIENEADGSLPIHDMQVLFCEKEVEPPMTRVACIELAFLDEGGRVPTLDWLQEIKDLCDQYVCPIHCDGRLFFQACARYEIEAELVPKQIASGISSMTISLHKSFNYPMGAVLVGSFDFIKRARSVRQVLGAETHQLGMAVCVNIDQKLQFYSSELMRAHKSACTIASYLSKSSEDSNVWVHPEQIETNVIHLHTKRNLAKPLIRRLQKISPQEIGALQSYTRILSSYVDASTVRLVISHDISKGQARKIGKKILMSVADLQYGSEMDSDDDS